MNKTCFLLSLLVMAALQATAGNLSEADARLAANRFIHRQAVATAMFKTAPAASLTLAHAEPSQSVAGACDYYAYNVAGGGWVIISGEDRAVRVLGYSDSGCFDYGHLPCNLKALAEGYKREMDYLRSQVCEWAPAAEVESEPAIVVEPLIATTWGQSVPYNLQCPVYRDEYCVVGCVATAMAQVMKYWQYPQSCDTVASYYCSKILTRLAALPPTTFDYSLMLDSYCHWDWDNGELVQDPYTDEQAQEVAKLSRYCGQAARMSYNPQGCSTPVSSQLRAMKEFGYRPTAKAVRFDIFGVNAYNTQKWDSLMRQELDAGRPILYSALDLGKGAHAFICDGYDSEGRFHFNMGWYGNCNGWYVVSALQMYHHDGFQLDFDMNHEMLVGIEPPEGWEPSGPVLAGDLDGNGSVDVDDLNVLVNLILELDTRPAPGSKPDLNGDNSVDIVDVSLLVNLILSN